MRRSTKPLVVNESLYDLIEMQPVVWCPACRQIVDYSCVDFGAVMCPDCKGETVDWDDWHQIDEDGMLYKIAETGLMFVRARLFLTEDGL